MWKSVTELLLLEDMWVFFQFLGMFPKENTILSSPYKFIYHQDAKQKQISGCFGHMKQVEHFFFVFVQHERLLHLWSLRHVSFGVMPLPLDLLKYWQLVNFFPWLCQWQYFVLQCFLCVSVSDMIFLAYRKKHTIFWFEYCK